MDQIAEVVAMVAVDRAIGLGIAIAPVIGNFVEVVEAR